MLSISKITSADYYINLAAEDYYQSGKEPPGRWHGELAKEFGLTEPVGGREYARLMAGQHPHDGKKLVKSAGSDRHRAGWDFCWSAPKSVSTIWSQANPELRQAIEQAQTKSVAAGREHIDEQLYTRRGAGGVESEYNLKSLWADFDHSTSRVQDPQLHTHDLLFNVCQRVDGTFGTLQTIDAFRAKMGAGAVYRAELANQMQQLGFKVERDGNSFRIAGNQSLRELEAEFSKRRLEIKSKLAAKGLNGAVAAEVAALDTRQNKELINREELFAQWQSTGVEFGYQLDSILATEAEPIKEPTDKDLLQKLTEQASTVSKHDIVRLIATESQGLTNAEGIKQRVAQLLESPEIVRLIAATGETRYSTREMVELERDMSTAAKRMASETGFEVKSEALDSASASRTLSGQQQAALDHITQPNRLANIQGMAGAGKSYLLGAAAEAWQQSGLQVRGATLAGKAAASLQEGSGIEAQTIHSLLADIEDEKTKLNSKTVLVIDEAGMVGSRQTAKLMDLVDKAGAKLVLVGDTRQLQPIDAGGAFRAIQQRIGAAELTEIRRQKDLWQSQAVHALADGRTAEALAEYAERGQLHVGQNRDAARQQMTSDWYAAASKDQGRAGEYLMLAATRSDAAKLNSLARDRMSADARLGASAEIVREGQTTLDIAEGDRLLFTRNSKLVGVKNGQLGSVDLITGSPGGEGVRVKVNMDDGRQVVFDSCEYDHIDLGYAVTTHKAQGVTVDQAFVLGGGTFSSRELSYVQGSRQRERLTWYFDREDLVDEVGMQLADDERSVADQLREIQSTIDRMSKERQAETTLDYSVEQKNQNEKAPEVEIELDIADEFCL